MVTRVCLFGDADPRCGKRNTYQKKACRGTRCTQAQTDYQNGWTARRIAEGKPPPQRRRMQAGAKRGAVCSVCQTIVGVRSDARARQARAATWRIVRHDRLEGGQCPGSWTQVPEDQLITRQGEVRINIAGDS